MPHRRFGSSQRTRCDHRDDVLRSASPRVPQHLLIRHPGSTLPPAPHTPDEIRALVRMLHTAGASTISLGRGRHPTSAAAAVALADAWTRVGGTVLDAVDWPEQAASWLKQARQLVRTQPDAWVIIDNPAGWAQLAARLSEHEDWSPARTFGSASLDSPDTAALTGSGVLTGMPGVSRDGAPWRVGHSGILLHPATLEPQ